MPTEAPGDWQGLSAHLRLTPTGDGRYEGVCLAGRGDRIFGGHVGAHALVAADSASRAGLAARSIHVSFLSAGNSNEPVTYTTTLLRRGRTLEHWHVDASQGPATLATAIVALDTVEETTAAHAADAGARPVEPASLRPVAHAPREGTSRTIRLPFEMLEGEVLADDGSGVPRRDVWFRCTESLPEDRLSRAAVAVFASDLELAWTADLPHVDRIVRRSAASLDHAVWLHRDWDLSTWWLYRLSSPALAESRAFLTGEIYGNDGRLVASVAQQALVRTTLSGS